MRLDKGAECRDPPLRDTTVLRPDWLANGIYAILRANDTRHAEPLARDGIVTSESLGRIYNPAEKLEIYPREKWSFVLRLMSKEPLPLLQSPRCCGAFRFWQFDILDVVGGEKLSAFAL